MKEILDEDKSVCFIHLYPSIVQINRAKKLSDEPLKLLWSLFFGGVHRTVQRNSSLRLQAPYLSLFSKLQNIYIYIYVLLLPFNIQVLIFVVFEQLQMHLATIYGSNS